LGSPRSPWNHGCFLIRIPAGDKLETNSVGARE